MQMNARYGLMPQVDLIFPLFPLDVFTAAARVFVWALEILALNINFSPRVLRKQDYLVHESIIILIFILLTMYCLAKLLFFPPQFSENPFAQVI